MNPLKPPTAAPAPRGARSLEFRHAIVAAQADGLGADDLILRLTLRDEADLKRDPSVKIEEISFAGGVMRFLGVKVVAGGVPVSGLDRGEG